MGVFSPRASPHMEGLKDLSYNQAPDKGSDGKRVVYTMFFRHWKTGKIVRRSDGRPFRFEV